MDALPPDPAGKDGVLTRYTAVRLEIAGVIADLSTAELISPLLEADFLIGGWSIKDYLAHLATWEQRVVAYLRGEPPHLRMYEHAFLTGMDAERFAALDQDSLNGLIDWRSGERSLEDVLEAYALAGRDLTAALEETNDEDLRRIQGGEAGADPWSDPLIRYYAYEHHREHLAGIRATITALREQEERPDPG